jgi:hypothetical protein
MATFQFTREEYVAASMGLAKKRMTRFILLLAAIVAAIATFRIIGNNNALAGVPYVVALLIMVPVVIFVSKHRLGKTFDDQASLRETFTAEIGEEGIRYTHTNGTRMLHWGSIRKWGEDHRFLYFFESDLYARILPKRAVSAEENELIRSRLAGVPTK